MKQTILFLALVISSNLVSAQDIITKVNGEDIKAKVIEVTTTEVKYKKFDNVNSPTYSVPIYELILIRYEDGTKDLFNDKETKGSKKTDLASRAEEDASTFYRGHNSGAVTTAVITALTSPIIGLVPAIACSLSEPSDRNLNYKDAELMKNSVYNDSYVKQAYKIKKRKIWTAFGIGSAGWLSLILLLTGGY